jgi:methylase of polypeptide subunit release factors
MEFRISGTDFAVCHDSSEDGGGSWFGQEYIPIIRSRYQRRFHHCLEWCAGPGFIGFGIMAHDLCDHLTLMDLNPQAQISVAETCDRNQCWDQVEFYLCDRVSALPQKLQFDLVVANPPHYLECPGDDNYQRLAVDQNWAAHEEFFQNIGCRLAADGVILLQENQTGSLGGVADFWHMIHCNGLAITAYWTSVNHWDTSGPTQIYYIEIQHRQKKL